VKACLARRSPDTSSCASARAVAAGLASHGGAALRRAAAEDQQAGAGPGALVRWRGP